MHYAKRWILLSEMKYKLLCCFFNNFLNVKKHNYKGNPCQNFQFCSHTGPRFPFFEAFFVAAPPSNKEERGENFWENIGSVVRWYFVFLFQNYNQVRIALMMMPLQWWWCQCNDILVLLMMMMSIALHCTENAQCVNGWSKWIVLENKTLHFKMV